MVDFDTRANLLYDANKKSLILTYVFWLFLGWASMHRFYLRKWETGAAQLLMMMLGTSFIFYPDDWVDKIDSPGEIGFLLLGIWGAWLLLDIILIPTLVRKFNVRLIEQMPAS